MVNVFAVPVFFICFRESLETGIIVSVLLGFLKQMLGPDRDPTVYKKLVRQVWVGTAIGLFICIIVGAGLIGAFYNLGKNAWANTESIWEGVFALLASLIITLMGAALLRVSKLQDKWRVKLAKAIEAKDSTRSRSTGTRFKVWLEKYAMFTLPFITVLREGLEAVVFIGGVSLGYPASAFPLPVILGVLAGTLVSFLIYKGANYTSIQWFLIVSTCFLYLIAAGLFSRAVWLFEADKWNHVIGGDASETGAGAGSYDIRKSVWHVNCCSPTLNQGGGWGIFNALFGWQNSATYGSVISYNMYWIAVILGFIALRFHEKRAKSSKKVGSVSSNEAESASGKVEGNPTVTSVRSVES